MMERLSAVRLPCSTPSARRRVIGRISSALVAVESARRAVAVAAIAAGDKRLMSLYGDQHCVLPSPGNVPTRLGATSTLSKSIW